LLKLPGGFMGQGGKRLRFGVITALAVTAILTALGVPQFLAYPTWAHSCVAFSPTPTAFKHCN
jgi:hypothetical protein